MSLFSLALILQSLCKDTCRTQQALVLERATCWFKRSVGDRSAVIWRACLRTQSKRRALYSHAWPSPARLKPGCLTVGRQEVVANRRDRGQNGITIMIMALQQMTMVLKTFEMAGTGLCHDGSGQSSCWGRTGRQRCCTMPCAPGPRKATDCATRWLSGRTLRRIL